MGLDPSVWKPVEQVTSLLLFLRCLTRTLTCVESHTGRLEEHPQVKVSMDFSLDTHLILL